MFFFFFNDTATTEIYTLFPTRRSSDLTSRRPSGRRSFRSTRCSRAVVGCSGRRRGAGSRGRARSARSEEHTSELQSQSNLVCRLLLEKKKKNKTIVNAI